MKPSKINFGSKNKKPLFEKKKPKPVKIPYGPERNVEVDAELELTELQKSFRKKAQEEKELKELNTSSEFWSQIIFKSKEQRDQFYELLGMKNEDNQYINGQKLIQALELRIELLERKTPGKFRVNKEILELSLSL